MKGAFMNSRSVSLESCKTVIFYIIYSTEQKLEAALKLDQFSE